MNIANDIFDAMSTQIGAKLEAQKKVEELTEQIKNGILRNNQLTEELKVTKIELTKLKEVGK